MAFAQARSAPAPLGEINTTPLIDVLLVLLVMLVITIPAATNSVDVDLPQVGPPIDVRTDVNRLEITNGGELLWNGKRLEYAQLDDELGAAASLHPEPELDFAPEANASYRLAADVINRIKRAGITHFGFVGNERFRDFGKAD